VSALPQANNAQVANGANIHGAERLWALQQGIPDRGWCARGKEKAALSSQYCVIQWGRGIMEKIDALATHT